jgi:hypothetical protein
MSREDQSISDRLADWGVDHEAGSDQPRVVRWHGKSLGMMDAEQASNLLALLDYWAGAE